MAGEQIELRPLDVNFQEVNRFDLVVLNEASHRQCRRHFAQEIVRRPTAEQARSWPNAAELNSDIRPTFVEVKRSIEARKFNRLRFDCDDGRSRACSKYCEETSICAEIKNSVPARDLEAGSLEVHFATV